MAASGPIETWAVTRLHNAMVIIEVDDATILTDPWFVDSRAFVGASPVGAHELPRLTAIIGSHWAKDHWGLKELREYPHGLRICRQHGASGPKVRVHERGESGMG